MVGGAGYMAGKSMANRSANEQDQSARIDQLEAQQAAAAPPPPPAAAPAPAGDDLVSKIKQLSDLKDAGVLTDAEFAAAKQKLIAG
jgi:membrane protease subunit (stomatin/prohibitin family)